jgi:hypothetical protein
MLVIENTSSQSQHRRMPIPDFKQFSHKQRRKDAKEKKQRSLRLGGFA